MLELLKEPYYKIIVVMKSNDKDPEDSDEINWMNFKSTKQWRMLDYFEAIVGISYWVLSPGNINIISDTDNGCNNIDCIVSELCTSVSYHQVSLSSYFLV